MLIQMEEQLVLPKRKIGRTVLEENFVFWKNSDGRKKVKCVFLEELRWKKKSRGVLFGRTVLEEKCQMVDFWKNGVGRTSGELEEKSQKKNVIFGRTTLEEDFCVVWKKNPRKKNKIFVEFFAQISSML